MVPAEGNSGYQCNLCGFYADKETMFEHIRSAEHLQRASKSPDGVWANPSQKPIVAPSGAASGSSSSQSGPSWAEIEAAGLNVVRDTVGVIITHGGICQEQDRRRDRPRRQLGSRRNGSLLQWSPERYRGCRKFQELFSFWSWI
mgnify:CR=1 FL=1